MILISFVLLYLAIVKQFEPLLLMTIVVLNTGEKGSVVRQNQSLPTSPVIQLVSEMPQGMVPTGKEVDLTKNLSLIITDTVEM